MPKHWQKIPNRDLFKGIAFLALIVVISHFKEAFQEQLPTSEILPALKSFEPPKKGVMVTQREHVVVELPLTGLSHDRLLMRRYANRVIGLMGEASDHQYYYAHAYYQDFIPFPVSNVYNAMNFIAMRLQYQYDATQFGGIEDLWQTSKEAYVRMRGDCEDHAILLADWLESLGYDVRVAVGKYKDEGHAWVVWFNQGQAYIIEATSKRKRRQYPLATTMHDYKAYFMFNKKDFWVYLHPHFINNYKTGWFKTAWFKSEM